MSTVAGHPLNWYAGWILILTAFLTGAGLGLSFHREDFWGGYASFRRRLVRLGHIALAKSPEKDAGKQKKADFIKWAKDLTKAGEEFTAAAKGTSGPQRCFF